MCFYSVNSISVVPVQCGGLHLGGSTRGQWGGWWRHGGWLPEVRGPGDLQPLHPHHLRDQAAQGLLALSHHTAQVVMAFILSIV